MHTNLKISRMVGAFFYIKVVFAKMLKDLNILCLLQTQIALDPYSLLVWQIYLPISSNQSMKAY